MKTESLNGVFDFAGQDKLNTDVSRRINALRNNIAHGNNYDFGGFIEEWIGPKDGKKYPAINGKIIDDIAKAVWVSIQKLAKEG